MRSLTTFFVFFFLNSIIAQNTLSITSNIGISEHLTSYPNIRTSYQGSTGIVLPLYGRTYLGFDKELALSAGLSYETLAFRLFKRQHFFMLEGKLSYRNNFDIEPFYFLGIDVYLPLRVTDRKWRTNLGARYAMVLSNFDSAKSMSDPIYLYKESTKANNNWGLTYLFSYQISEQLNIGLNFYHDLWGFAQVYLYNTFKDRIELTVQHLNYEIMLRVSYQLRDYKERKK